MSKVMLTGGAYTARSVIASAQRSLNLVPEPLPEAQGEPAPVAHYPTPGLRLLSTIGTGPIRGIRQATTGGLYVVSGSGVYSVNTTTWTGTHLGDITAGLITPVSMADNGLDLVIVDGTANGWVVNLASNAFAQYADQVAHPMGAGTVAFSGLSGLNLARSTQVWTAPSDGLISSITVSAAAAATVHVKAALYSVDGVVVKGADKKTPSQGSISSVAVGPNTIALSPPAAVLSGDLYYVVINHDATVDWNYDAAPTGFTFVMPLADFPPAKLPAHTDNQDSIVSTFTVMESRGTFYGADRVDYLDTYLLFNKPGTPQFYISDSLAVTFDPNYWANKQTYSDLLVTLCVAKREVYLLGERTTEIWYDAGATDTGAGSFPFAEVQGVFIDHGIVAKYSVANYDNALFWLSRDRQGQGIVLSAADYKTKRVSTYAIETEISGYSRIDDAIGYCYQLAGHAFYVLIFPHADKTWVYDITTELWHEWVWIDVNGEEHRHRSNCHWPVAGLNVVGDWQNGNLYALDRAVFTDNGSPIKRVRSFPHLVADGKRLFFRQFVADIETGNPGSPPVITSHVETSIIWPPQIAQLTGVSVGAMMGVSIDWGRGLLYMIGQTGFQKYTTTLATQTPLVTTVVPSQNLWGADVDPLSGALIMQGGPGATNGQPIRKFDPNTFAVQGTFGVHTSGPSYPTSVWAGEGIACVVCNGVSFGFLKYSEFSGAVAGFRVDTMQHSGFIADIVSGSTNNRGLIIAGKSGGNAASVFLSWSSTTTPQPAVPLYRIDVAASATAYVPATWPATNPGITWTTVGTIPVAAVDPAWTGFTVFSIGYDLADGNVLMMAGTLSTADGYRLLKLDASTAAVLWSLAIGTTTLDLGGSRINGSLWTFRNPGAGAGPTTSYRINTLTGTMETQPIAGVFAQTGASSQQIDSATSLMFFGGRYATSVANGPVPVEGTSFFESGWATMGGQTSRVVTTAEGGVDGDLISLECSNDRGHSWGNPVSQSIGNAGEYRKSLLWRRLGYARDRTFRISWSTPCATALQGCWLDAEPGDGGQEKK